MISLRTPATALLAVALAVVSGCTVEDSGTNTTNTSSGSDGTLEGTVSIDGSSTVFPITQAVAEEFMQEHPDVRISVGTSGTGGGFKKFNTGEIDINDASRPIKETEVQQAEENRIEFVELKVALDGLSVVVNPENDWADAMTVAELKNIWEPNSQVEKWSDIRDGWPDEEIRLYGPDTESGTFDYFTDEIVGESGASRSDYTANTDDNFLVKGVASDQYALGYFGYAYYVENADQLKAVAIAPGDDLSAAVAPTAETVESGQYTPLSRPLFLYVTKNALERLEVAEFLEYYLSDEGQDLVEETGYVRVSQDALQQARRQLQDAIDTD